MIPNPSLLISVILEHIYFSPLNLITNISRGTTRAEKRTQVWLLRGEGLKVTVRITVNIFFLYFLYSFQLIKNFAKISQRKQVLPFLLYFCPGFFFITDSAGKLHFAKKISSGSEMPHSKNGWNHDLIANGLSYRNSLPLTHRKFVKKCKPRCRTVI